MASTNNPETTPVAPQVPAVNTQVKVGETTFELRAIKTDAGLQLYNALPAANKAEADRLAYVVKTFLKVQQAASKHNVDPTELAKNWIKAGNDVAAKNALPPEQQQAIQELSSSGLKIDELAHMIPGGDSLLAATHVADGAATVAGVATGAAGAAFDGTFSGAPRVWGLLSTMGTEAWGQIFGYGGGTPDDSAKVFAAATVALRMDAINKRHAMPMMSVPFVGQPSQITSNPIQYAEAGLGTLTDWIMQHIPGVEYIMAGFKWLTASTENKPAFSQFVEQARADIEASKQKAPTDMAHLGEHFAQRADAAMYDKEGDQVRQSLEAATTIAGMSTKGLATAATATDVTVRSNDGVDTTLSHGDVTQQVTPGQRLQNAASNVTGNGSVMDKTVRVAASIGGVALVGNGVRGVAEGLVAQPINTPEKAAEKAANRAAQLEEKLAVAEKQAPKTSAWEIHKTSVAKQEAMRAEVEMLKGKAETAAAKAALNKAGTGEFTAGALTPLKDLNDGSKIKALINLPRGIGRVIGDKVAGIAVFAKDTAFATFPAIKNLSVGFGHGVDNIVNSTVGQKAASALETTGSMIGKGAAQGVKFFAPGVEAVKTLGDISKGDTAGIVAHGGATVAMGGAMVTTKLVLKGTVGEAVPFLSPIMDSGDLAYSIAHKDKGGIIRSSTSLGTTGAGAAIGAGIGVWFFGVGAIPGAAVGATIGGLVGIGTGWWAQHHFAPEAPVQAAAPVLTPVAQAAAPAQTAGLSHDEILAAAAGVKEQAQMAMKRGMSTSANKLANFNLGTQFAKVDNTTIGGFTSTAQSGSTTQQAAQHVVA